MVYYATVSGFPRNSRLRVLLDTNGITDVSKNTLVDPLESSPRDSSFSLSISVAPLRPAVSSVESPTTLAQIPVRILWNYPVFVNDFTLADVVASDDDGRELSPTSKLLPTGGDGLGMRNGREAPVATEFTVFFNTSGAKAVNVQVLQGALIDYFGSPSEASLPFRVRIALPRKSTACMECMHGVCWNNTCLCDPDWTHDIDYLPKNDCSVPLPVRRALFNVGVGLSCLLALGSLVRLMTLPAGGTVALKRVLVSLLSLVALGRVAFFVYRLNVATWDTVDALLVNRLHSLPPIFSDFYYLRVFSDSSLL